jgi:Domain of unknown function DUF29
MDGPSLYETDILAWTEQQAAALRDLAARRDLPNALDLENVIEEIESLGRNEFKAATSPIRLILGHLLKAASDPDAPARTHWFEEILRWHGDMKDALTPSMHQRVDMDALWRRALSEAASSLALYGKALLPGLPRESPFTLLDFLGESFDIQAALARLRATTTNG